MGNALSLHHLDKAIYQLQRCFPLRSQPRKTTFTNGLSYFDSRWREQ